MGDSRQLEVSSRMRRGVGDSSQQVGPSGQGDLGFPFEWRGCHRGLQPEGQVQLQRHQVGSGG